MCEGKEAKQTVADLQTELVSLYIVILHFLTNTIRVYKKGAMRRTLSAISKPEDEIIEFLKSCEACENGLEIAVKNCERLHTRNVHAYSNEQVRILKDLLMDLHEPVLRIESGVAALLENLDTSVRLQILEWISSIRHEENHHFARWGRTDATGQWLLRWRKSVSSTVLWLHGDREFLSGWIPKGSSLTMNSVSGSW